MQSTGQTSTHALSLTPMHASVITYVMKPGLLCASVSRRARIEIRIGLGRRKGIAALLFSLLGAPLQAQSVPACEGGKTALVLSGGGAKGMAHIALLGLLDSLGAVPDLVVGTSIGSVM